MVLLHKLGVFTTYDNNYMTDLCIYINFDPYIFPNVLFRPGRIHGVSKEGILP